ncbi:13248_t:CDS:2 [Ambispora leptoticha]|uniref:13248_t:CDS:1 n=1 Tax=Ambispora leptoticha TaxID=144679 RepID=A0A9N8W0Z1_9GLOM|nr:13248_t:CDS:2 [Ambispora leptoticha]
MEEFFEEEFYLQASRPAPPPPSPTSTTCSPRKSSFTSTNDINYHLPYSFPATLFHRTLNPRINNKHQDVARAKIKSAIERELREEKLRDAACRGDCDKIMNLLALKPVPDINQADDKGRTPLHFACAGGHIDAVKLLIAHGANVNADADVVGNRPLHLAVISNKLECVVALLEAAIEEREVFRQVLQITKILRHYISLQNDSTVVIDQEKNEHEDNMMSEDLDSQDTHNNSKTSSITRCPYSTVETLDSLTEQLSRLAMTSEENNSSEANRNNIIDSDSHFHNQSLTTTTTTMTTTARTKTMEIPSKFLSAQDANVLNQVQSVLDTLIIQNKI